MTINEIIKKIEDNRNKKFYLDMKDHWTDRDYNVNATLTNEYVALLKEYKEKTGHAYVE